MSYVPVYSFDFHWTRPEMLVQFFPRKIEPINIPTRHVYYIIARSLAQAMGLLPDR